MNGQAIGVHHRVNPARQPASRTTYVLVTIVVSIEIDTSCGRRSPVKARPAGSCVGDGEGD
jgi:hypothetical protein